ncbi:MAG: hypothetical protein UH083_00875 [Ruminococcus sp.]|nr:hypothetical protein [Ruminococcus sp.]
MEGFIEQVVKRDKTAKSLAIKIISVALLFVIPLTFVFLARFISFYLALVGFFIFVGGIYVVWWIFTSQKVEYEYSVNIDTLDIAKVISLRRRKRMLSIEIKDIEMLEFGDKNIADMHFRKVYPAAKNINDTENNVYAVFTEQAYGKCLLVFNPNEEILNAMKPHMKRELVVKIFYKKDRT